jgi:predicted AlkP superfamily pyrophosphatase or phosphodiesterase
MVNKHKEMDAIIKNIYELLQEKDRQEGKKSLILVAGDHGMADVLSLICEVHYLFPRMEIMGDQARKK